jgi:hypothetical protein
MKNLITPLLMATALIATACTNTTDIDNHDVDPSGKTPISFVGENSNAPVTRAGFQCAEGSYTQIAMHIRSTKSKSEIKETRILAKAANDATNDPTSVSDVTQDDSYIRYWDDAYGRDAKLSVFAIAVPGKASATNNTETLEKKLAEATGTWNSGALSETVSWTLSTDQSADGVLANEDLTYSNNIKEKDNGGVGGAKAYNYTTKDWTDIVDGQMQFRLKAGEGTAADGPGKFDKGHLLFKHALSRITINLIKGTGFGDKSFNFEDGTNVKIKGVHTTGSLDIQNGSWTLPKTAPTGITKMAKTEIAKGATHSLIAQMLPGLVINKDNNTNVLEFTIDGNAYYVTQDMMYNALDGVKGTTTVSNTITMEQGNRYVFNITVNKTQISNLTASLEEFIPVTANGQTLDNSKDNTITFYTGSKFNDTFDLYRLCVSSVSSESTWGGNYTDMAEIKDGNGLVESKWYFENDNSFYHFRAVNHGIKIQNATTDADDYFIISSGNDYLWGAPILSSVTSSPIEYSKTKGYTAVINPSIGATTQAINLTEFNVMSKIKVVLRTTKTDNKVVLDNGTDQCSVALTYFYADGQVKMGNGLVSTTGDIKESAPFAKPDKGTTDDGTNVSTGEFTYSVVPQSLVRSVGTNLYVGITITTVDGNKYYITEKLSDILPTGVGGSLNQNATDKITEWFPNHSYTYTFTLTKTGISNVTCSVQDYIPVTAKDQTITLE